MAKFRITSIPQNKKLDTFAEGGDPGDPFLKRLMSQIKKGNESKKPTPSLTRKTPTQPTNNSFSNKSLLNKEIKQQRNKNKALKQTLPEIEIIGKRSKNNLENKIPKNLILPSNINSMNYDWKKGAMIPDSFRENIGEFIDPTGYTSWDDAYRAYTEWDESGKELPSLSQAADMFGAVPVLGKLGKLKYLVEGEGLVKSAYKYLPWQQIVNTFDTVDDIETDNVNKKKNGGSLDTYAGGGGACPRGYTRDATGKCVPYNFNDVQAADSYTGMYGGYDSSGVKNLKQVSTTAKKGKKFADYVLRGGKSKADVARNLGKTAGQYFGMPGEVLEPTNFTKAGLEKYTKVVKDAKKNFDAEAKNYQDYLKAKEKVATDKMDTRKYADKYNEKNWSQYDQNIAKGSGPDADYSAKEAKAEWKPEIMQDVGDYAHMAAMGALGIAGAGALSGAARSVGNAVGKVLSNPFVSAPLSAYGVYDAATNTLPEAYRDFKGGRYLEGFGNVALAGLDLMPGAVLGDFKRLGKAVSKGASNTKKAYVNAAEGDNMFNYAWRSPASRFDDAAIKPSYEEIMPQSQAEFDKLRSLDNLTDQQKIYLKDYEINSRAYTGRGWEKHAVNPHLDKKTAFEQMVANAKLQSDNPFVMTRRTDSSNPQLFNMNKGVYEPNRITSWSAGRDAVGNKSFSGGKDRFVIKNKAGESNLLKNPYKSLNETQKQQYKTTLQKENPDWSDEWLDKSADLSDVNRTFERELLLPADAKLKQLGKVKNKMGGYDYVMKSTDQLKGNPFLSKSKQSLNKSSDSDMFLDAGDDFTKEIQNVNHYKQLLDTYDHKALSIPNKKYYNSLINKVKSQGGKLTERQYNDLQRLKTGNFNFGIKGNFSQSKKNPYNEIIDSPSYREWKEMDPENVRLADQQINKGNKWLQEWMSDPATQKRIKETGFADDPKVKKNLEDYISGKNVVKGFVPDFNDYQLAYGHYIPSKNKAFVDITNPNFMTGEKSIPSTTLHEGTHITSKGDLAYNDAIKDDVMNIFTDDSWSYDRMRKNAGASRMFDAPEVHARIMQLRQQYGIRPGQKVDQALIDKIVKEGLEGGTFVSPKFFEKISSNKNFKKAFNTLPAVVPIAATAAGTAAMIANPFQGSDGLQQQKKGGATNNFIELELPKNEIQDYINQGYIVEEID